ncbi:hypothetical protein [Holdemanella biformis]|jgi:hypothetical protein|uniref:Uncharacterized protein n=1 Tax=Holdemanella biformis DSM 3989 TaxID=518637 RepID=B7CCV2_9FIRM|nr:hypothetical protein [Holdemanella biformis]EEC89433.1 hypothetical protein EUBIFOR_02030 [Holdemanella biformis DSM 3989]
MAKPYNHRRAENEYKKWKNKDDQFMVKIESQNTIKNQRLSVDSIMIIRMKNVMMSQIM